MKVYLAGGINGLSDADAVDWRQWVKSALPLGLEVLDPMARDYRGKEDESVEAIVKGDLDDIEQCSAVIAYCPRPSWGTAMEIHHVATAGRFKSSAEDPWKLIARRCVAVVPAGTAVSPWLRYHTDAVVETLVEAVELVEGWLLP